MITMWSFGNRTIDISRRLQRYLSTIASLITRSRSFTKLSHYHHHQLQQQLQQRIQQQPKTQSQYKYRYSILYSLPPDDTAAKNSVQISNNRSLLKEAITNYFNTPSIKPFSNDNESHLYLVRDEFTDPYWMNDIASDRFNTSFCNGILYRPEIVDEICTAVATNLANVPKQGLMIKGPPGIGKSHSIINVVRKLQSTEQYLVTYIPDCKSWTSSFHLIERICSSIGTTAEALGIEEYDDTPATLLKLISDVTKVLEASDKQWVFVFDQINRIFAGHPDKKEIFLLPFPFNLIENVMKVGRITSIISASANNAISYKDRHDGLWNIYMKPP